MPERRAETRAPNLRYPQELVRRYGAKAGILLYVADNIPDIPQAPMVVSEIGESADSLLVRADEAGIDWPRLFRSSAEAELVGYEGVFRTEEIKSFEEGHANVSWNPNNYSIYRNREYFESGIRQSIDDIKSSPVWLKEREEGHESLPNEINVIVAEKAKSGFVGTYIKHPNREGFFLITISSSWTMKTYDADRTSFSFSNEEGVRELRRYSVHHFGGEELEQQLAQIASWHDRIASLPDMDPSWSYQIEFGVDPPCLFQVRPFKPMKKPTFKLRPGRFEEHELAPIVLGTTPSRGVVLKVVDDSSIPTPESVPTEEDCVYVGDMLGSWRSEEFPNLKATILTRTHGFLQHNDVATLRRSQVTALIPSFWYSDYPRIKPGEYVRIRSDGQRMKITPIDINKAEIPE